MIIVLIPCHTVQLSNQSGLVPFPVLIPPSLVRVRVPKQKNNEFARAYDQCRVKERRKKKSDKASWATGSTSDVVSDSRYPPNAENAVSVITWCMVERLGCSLGA